MQLDLHESIVLAEEIERGVFDCPESVRIILCPAFTALPSLQHMVRRCMLGAQDMFWENRGAFTGEIAPRMLTELGCRAVILGHSERRENLGETDAMIQRKVRAALEAKMTPIVCVGETHADRVAGRGAAVVRAQIESIFQGVDIGTSGTVYIAYEPRWAIGTGDAVASGDAEHMHQIILHTFHDLYPGHSLDTRVQVLYGGSVDRRNAAALLTQPSIAGLLVGTASRRIEDFLGVVAAVNALT